MVTALWVEHSESPFADQMALFQHILRNDAQWSLVLKQKVKLSNLSPPMYARFNSNDEDVKKIELMTNNDDQNPTAMYVLQKLMGNSLRSGSNVNFTSFVLKTAVTCFTYNNLSFMLTLLDRIDISTIKIVDSAIQNDEKNNNNEKPNNNNEKKSDDMSINDLINKTLVDVRMIFEVFIDKLAAVDGELAFFTTALYDYYGAKKTNDNHILFNVLKLVKKEVEMKIDKYCHLTHTEIFEYLKKDANLVVSKPPPDASKSDELLIRCQLEEFQKVIDCILDVYDKLNIETMPMVTWMQILYYRIPLEMGIQLYIHNEDKNPNPPMTDRLKEAMKKGQEEKKAESSNP